MWSWRTSARYERGTCPATDHIVHRAPQLLHDLSLSFPRGFSLNIKAVILDLKFRMERWYQLAYEDALRVEKELRFRADRERELDQQKGIGWPCGVGGLQHGTSEMHVSAAEPEGMGDGDISDPRRSRRGWSGHVELEDFSTIRVRYMSLQRITSFIGRHSCFMISRCPFHGASPSILHLSYWI